MDIFWLLKGREYKKDETMMNVLHPTDTPYLKKSQKVYKSLDLLLEFC